MGETREEKPQEKFQEKLSEKERTPKEGPSAIINVAGKKFAEYTDQQGNKWYQEIIDLLTEKSVEKTETTKTGQQKLESESKQDFPTPPDLSKFKTNGNGPTENNTTKLKEGEIVDFKNN